MGGNALTRAQRELLDRELTRAVSGRSGDVTRPPDEWQQAVQADDLQTAHVPFSEWGPAHYRLHELARNHRVAAPEPDPLRAEAQRRAAKAFPDTEQAALVAKADAAQADWEARQAAHDEAHDALRRASATTWIGDRKVDPPTKAGDVEALRDRLRQLAEETRLAREVAERARVRLTTWRVARDRLTSALDYELQQANGNGR